MQTFILVLLLLLSASVGHAEKLNIEIEEQCFLEQGKSLIFHSILNHKNSDRKRIENVVCEISTNECSITTVYLSSPIKAGSIVSHNLKLDKLNITNDRASITLPLNQYSISKKDKTITLKSNVDTWTGKCP